MFQLAIKTVDTIRKNGIEATWRKARFYFERRKGIRDLKTGLRDYNRWLANNRSTDSTRAEIYHELKRLEYKPKISIVMPVYNVSGKWLQRAIKSVLAQSYDDWE